MHPNLERQLTNSGITDRSDTLAPDALTRLLESIDRSYQQADEDRYLLERSLDLTSNEMSALYEQLSQDRDTVVAVLSSVSDGVCAVDDKGNVLIANPRARQLLGITEEDVTQHRPFGSIVNAQTTTGRCSHTLFDDPVESSRQHGEAPRLIIDDDHDSYIEYMVHTLGADELGYVLTLRDVTIERRLARERTDLNDALVAMSRRAENEMRRARDAATESSRLKSEFLANMSHEIRTPMTAILGYVDILEDELCNPETPSDRRNLFRIIRANATHLLTIINDILDISKIDAGKLRIEPMPVDPLSLINDVLSILSHRAMEKSIALTCSHTDGVPTVIHSDPTRLRQILLNLVGNAIKFTDQGSVTVQVSTTAASEAGPSLEIEVVDTGIGLTPEQLQIISRFDAFAQADSAMTRRFGGTGLGLRISHSLAELLGGTLSVAVNVSRGCTFTLDLPLACETQASSNLPATRDAADAMRPSGAPARAILDVASALENVRVLVAEDSPDIRRLIEFLLRRAGADVESVENGQLALDRLIGRQSNEPAFDLVLMDMQMPVLDGYSATQRIRDAGLSIPVIALTAHAMRHEREKCLSAGCSDFATKPIDRTSLISLCAKWHRYGCADAAA